jgi:TPR repeat protein
LPNNEKFVRFLITSALLFFLCTSSTTAADFNKGLEAFNSGDFKTALQEWNSLAEQGDSKGQFNLGFMYAKGKGVEQDYSKALYWYKKAAEQGLTRAQNNIGTIYDNGIGVPKDDAKALHWYRKAAEQGNANGQSNLGFMYANGKGVPKDDAKALHWYRKAAEQGNANGQNNLGFMYANGFGVPEDYVFAYMWASLATAKGSEMAKELKNELKQLMTQSQIAEAQSLSREWKPGQKSEIPKRAATVPTRKQIPPDRTGSSFVVSANGDVLTNRHVVVGCNRLRVGGQNTKVIAQDPNNDLALLRTEKTANSFAYFREGRGARVGEKVSVAGYPLRGILGDNLNVSFGNISSLTGIGNDSRLFQISAPVNPGNSGGPLLDGSGNIIGVVTSKLNALFVAKKIGDIPQGANFAIKSSIVRIFLDLNNVDYETARSRTPKTTTKVADEAQKYTLLVECWK